MTDVSLPAQVDPVGPRPGPPDPVKPRPPVPVGTPNTDPLPAVELYDRLRLEPVAEGEADSYGVRITRALERAESYALAADRARAGRPAATVADAAAGAQAWAAVATAYAACVSALVAERDSGNGPLIVIGGRPER